MAGGQLPEDVVRDILSRLPVKSLMRFSCVCKSWYDLIKSPNFIELHHLKNSSASIRRKSDCVIVIKCFLQPDDNNSVVLSFISNDTYIIVDMDIPFPKGEESTLLLGTCNGIVCITNQYGIVICNPATRQSRALDVTSPFAYPDDYMHWPDCVGFGFDPDTRDYKVVRIVSLMHKYEDFDNGNDYRVEVYNLSSNSWREIAAVLPASSIFILYSACVAPLFNGAFHWFARNEGKDEYILSFHIRNEVFQLIPFPDTLSFPDGHSRSLVVLNESLALIHYGDLENRPDVVGKHFDIWVLNEYGVKESWTRLLRIGPLLGIDFPLAFWNKKARSSSWKLAMDNWSPATFRT